MLFPFALSNSLKTASTWHDIQLRFLSFIHVATPERSLSAKFTTHLYKKDMIKSWNKDHLPKSENKDNNIQLF